MGKSHAGLLEAKGVAVVYVLPNPCAVLGPYFGESPYALSHAAKVSAGWMKPGGLRTRRRYLPELLSGLLQQA